MKTQNTKHKFHIAVLVMAALSVFCQPVRAQLFKSTSPEKQQTRDGNKQFKKENYADAEANYKKALDKKNNMPEAVFNLGDAVYEQKRYGEAAQQFDLSARTNPDPGVKAKALHNLGNTYMKQEKWEEAIRSYKSALRYNPNDKDTKYNLAYANEKLRQKNQQQPQNDKKDKKDEKKDEKKEDEKKDQRPDQNKDQQAKNEQQQQQPKPQLSKKDAEKLLQALNNEEQKTNQKMQQKQVKTSNVKILKDW